MSMQRQHFAAFLWSPMTCMECNLSQTSSKKKKKECSCDGGDILTLGKVRRETCNPGRPKAIRYIRWQGRKTSSKSIADSWIRCTYLWGSSDDSAWECTFCIFYLKQREGILLNISLYFLPLQKRGKFHVNKLYSDVILVVHSSDICCTISTTAHSVP